MTRKFTVALLLLLFTVHYVLSASVAKAAEPAFCPVNIADATTKFGFNQPSGSDNWKKLFNDPASYQTAFDTLKGYAINFAPQVGLSDPILVNWWAFTETPAPLDSYHYSNCLDQDRDVNTNCSGTDSGQWQLGYGEQFTTYPNLPQAFATSYKDPTDAGKTAQVGQNVLQKAGQTDKIFPQTSAQDGK